VHLEFLEALFVLRQRVLRSEDLDDVFDIKPEYKYVDRGGEQKRFKDTTLWERRQVKWERFVAFAVARFMAWSEKVCGIVRVRDDGARRELSEVTDDVLPPLGEWITYHLYLLANLVTILD
jgi:hypothetical protein